MKFIEFCEKVGIDPKDVHLIFDEEEALQVLKNEEFEKFFHIIISTDKVQMEAIKILDTACLLWFKEQSEKLQIEIINKLELKGMAYIKNPTEKVQLLVIEKFGLRAIGTIINPSDNVQLEIIKKFGFEQVKNYIRWNQFEF